MARSKHVDILHGNLFRSIIAYCIPVMIMGVIQKLFSAVDIMVLGWVADTNAVASVGATNPIIHLFIDSFFGISLGAKVVLSRQVGAGERDAAKKTVSTSVYTALILGALTAIIGFVFAPTFLETTKCPAECYDGALTYMRLYFIAAPAMLLYNYAAAVISVTGDTQRPLYYMLISGVLNVVLNLLLCMVMTEKVAAVALATAISQVVGAVLATVRLFKLDDICRLDIRKMKWSFLAFRKMMVNGVPISLGTALYPLANLQIQAAVNSFGASAIAAHTAESSIEGIISSISATPFANALTVFAGQNLGANQPQRVKRSIAWCIGMAAAVGLELGTVCYIFAKPLATLYVGNDPAALEFAKIRAGYTVRFYFIACINSCLSRIIQTLGYSFLTTVNSLVMVLGFRAVWMETVYVQYPTYNSLCMCFVVSWTLLLVINTVMSLCLYRAKLKKGLLYKVK